VPTRSRQAGNRWSSRKQVVLALLLLSNTGDVLVYTHGSLSELAGPDTARFAL
jgi:hypothetical protein